MLFSRTPNPIPAGLMLLALLSGGAGAKGIAVRFLACLPSDSIVRYEIYRSGSAATAPLLAGETFASPGDDTLSFRDVLAEKGKAYFYTIKAINAAGLASDPSGRTAVGYPRLSLPDTLRPGKTAGLTTSLPGWLADPLRGIAPLEVFLLDSSRFTLAYDSALSALAFRSRLGKADTGRIIVRARYFGKFEDRDTLVILTTASGTVALAGSPDALADASGASSRFAFPARYSPRSRGPIVLGAPPGIARVEIFSLRGKRVRVLNIPRNASSLAWDGRGGSGAYLRSAQYFWNARNSRGGIVESGSFLITP